MYVKPDFVKVQVDVADNYAEYKCPPFKFGQYFLTMESCSEANAIVLGLSDTIPFTANGHPESYDCYNQNTY